MKLIPIGKSLMSVELETKFEDVSLQITFESALDTLLLETLGERLLLHVRAAMSLHAFIRFKFTYVTTGSSLVRIQS